MTLAFLDNRSVVDSALHYHDLGLAVLPVGLRSKKPSVGEGWESYRITDRERIPREFRGRSVGVLLGEPSGWVVDVDLDAPEALKQAHNYLPRTVAFGRATNPRSHWIYRCAGVKYHKLLDPIPNANDEHDTLIELRAGTNTKGFQTVFPNSTHKDGEAIRWCDGSLDPFEIDAGLLTRNVLQLATATLLDRHAPGRTVDVMRRLVGDSSDPALRSWLATFLDLRVATRAADWMGVPRPEPRRPRPSSASQDIASAAAAYVRDHPREYPARGSDCPVCGSETSFKVHPENPDKWTCFSTRHDAYGVGTPRTDGQPHHLGNVLDLDAHFAGRAVSDHLQAEGYYGRRAAPPPPPPSREPGEDDGDYDEPPHTVEDSPETKHDYDADSVAALLPTYLTEIERGVPRVLTNFRELDRALDGGLPLRGLTVLGGEPKSNKSTISQRIAIEHVRHGGIARCYDFENGTARFLRRIICSEAKIGPRALQRMTAEEKYRFDAATQTVLGPLRELYVCTDRRMTPDMLREDVEEFIRRAGNRPLLLVVDSLQKLQIRDLSDRRAAIDEWLRVLEEIKNKHNVALLVISELKRPQHGKGYETGGTMFKESGDIEYTAELALTLEVEERDASGDLDTAAGLQPAEGPWVLLRVQYDREGRSGRVARYRAIFPHHGIEEAPLSSYKPTPKPTGRRRTGTEDDNE